MEKDNKFRNFINYPLENRYIEYPARPIKTVKPKIRNCCGGFSATGDGTDVAQPDTATTIAVQKVTAFNYVKLGLSIVGLVVVVKYIYAKFIK